MRKIFIVSGEVSGDKLGAWYLNRLKKENVNFECTAVGGNFLQQTGAKIYERIENLNIVGVAEIVKKLPFIFKFLKQLSNYIVQNNFEQVVLVDFPGFNVRLAKKLKELNPKISITYLSPPQTWIWGAWRIKKLKKYCDQLIVLYPFEVEWYKKHGLTVEFIGNPVCEELKEFMVRDDSVLSTVRTPFETSLRDSSGRTGIEASPRTGERNVKTFTSYDFKKEQKLEQIKEPLDPFVVRSEASRIHEHRFKTNQIAIIAGSRESEIKALFPTFAQIIKLFKEKYPDLKIVLPLAASISLKTVEEKLKEFDLSKFRDSIKIIVGEKEKIEELSKCCLAITKPGTVSLELGLLQVPAIVFYKTSWITYLLARPLVKVKYMSLPNLLLKEEVYKEFIQWNCTAKSIFKYSDFLYQSFLAQKKEYFEKLQKLQQLQKLLGSTLSEPK